MTFFATLQALVTFLSSVPRSTLPHLNVELAAIQFQVALNNRTLWALDCIFKREKANGWLNAPEEYFVKERERVVKQLRINVAISHFYDYLLRVLGDQSGVQLDVMGILEVLVPTIISDKPFVAGEGNVVVTTVIDDVRWFIKVNPVTGLPHINYNPEVLPDALLFDIKGYPAKEDETRDMLQIDLVETFDLFLGITEACPDLWPEAKEKFEAFKNRSFETVGMGNVVTWLLTSLDKREENKKLRDMAIKTLYSLFNPVLTDEPQELYRTCLFQYCHDYVVCVPFNFKTIDEFLAGFYQGLNKFISLESSTNRRVRIETSNKFVTEPK